MDAKRLVGIVSPSGDPIIVRPIGQIAGILLSYAGSDLLGGQYVGPLGLPAVYECSVHGPEAMMLDGLTVAAILAGETNATVEETTVEEFFAASSVPTEDVERVMAEINALEQSVSDALVGDLDDELARFFDDDEL